MKKLYITKQGITLEEDNNKLANLEDVNFYLCAGGILEGKYRIEGGVVNIIEDEDIGWDVKFEEDVKDYIEEDSPLEVKHEQIAS